MFSQFISTLSDEGKNGTLLWSFTNNEFYLWSSVPSTLAKLASMQSRLVWQQLYLS